MFFNTALTISLIIFGIGMIYKLSNWFRNDVGKGEKNISGTVRFSSAIEGFTGTIFSGKILQLIKAFFLDVILQIKILWDKEDPLVWIMHFLIFIGFTLLLFLHALGGLIFVDYQSTLNPFLFLRDFCGLLIIAGLVLAVVRRVKRKKDRVKTTGMDYYVIVILTIIIISGFVLQGFKISSYSEYRSMVKEYAETDDTAELKALEAFWIQKFGVVSPNLQGSFSDEMLTQGQDLHDMNCAGCHSRPQSAFISYIASRATKSISLGMESSGMVAFIWHIHILACFFGLAYLGFSKMFHIFATPISVLINSVSEVGKTSPANAATRQKIELDGCSHGGSCHMNCPVHIKRQERIAQTGQFEPELDFVDQVEWNALGNRPYRE